MMLSLLGIAQAVVQVGLASFYTISFLVILFLTYMLVTNSSLGVKSYCYPVHDVTVFR